MWPWHLWLGASGERQAERFLRRSGLSTVARRYRTPVGELDLVMRDGDTLVFVEVKTRRDRQFADPEDSITRDKRRKLIQAARWYCRHKAAGDQPLRFDVVFVIQPPGSRRAAELNHHPDAFAPENW